MRFPEDFLNELKSRVRLSDVVGRRVKLKRQGKDYVGLSPFSNEKTPSFHVHDDRGFYKCFSTQKGGDVITFVMETERLTFAEAVEKLARDAGLELPRASAEEQQTYRRRNTLIDWVGKAALWYEAQLRSPGGAEARAYLEKRGFGPEAWTRHRMGFAPAGWRNLSDELVRQGARVDELVEAGLLVEPDAEKSGEGQSRAPWDRFRNRVIFPISDPQGRVIAFGARTLDPDGKPKYLNSSDSPLFHKGRTLYRYGPAREAMADLKDGPLARGLIVTEGYVDAIALAEAGIGTAVAPLGTALTEEQIELLWRAGPEPVLCFDGDAAGVRAAHKALDRALPMVEPGRTLYFVALPEGLDPDDMIRTRGVDAMRSALAGARPMVDLLWSREIEAEPLDTPERRAGLEARLMAAVATIRHQGVRKAYERELRDRLFLQFRPARSGGSNAARPYAGEGASPGATRHTGLALLVRAVESPEFFDQARQTLAHADFLDPDIGAIRDAAFYVRDHADTLDRTAVAAHLRIFGRKRSIDLLEMFPHREPLDMQSTGGRDWLAGLERFVIAARLLEESRAVVRAEEGDIEVMSRQHEAQIRAVVLERKMAGRSSVDIAMSDPALEGVDELRSKLGGLDGEVKRRYPEG